MSVKILIIEIFFRSHSKETPGQQTNSKLPLNHAALNIISCKADARKEKRK